jgi:PAS domain S-box-containing protein
MATDAGLAPDALLKALLAAMDESGIGVTVVVSSDGSLRRAYSNVPAAAIFGMTVEELQATPPMLQLTMEERARLNDIRQHPGKAPSSLETKATRKDGTVVPVEVSMGIVPTEQGQAIVAFLRDVSPRVAMQEALRESEELLRTLAETSPDSITMYSEGRYVYANPVAMRIIGVKNEEELARHDPRKTIGDHRRDELIARGKRILAGQVEPPMEVRREIDGRESILEVSSRRATWAGKPALINYSRDITERKQLQARLMQQDRLAAVGTLAAGLGHEINNPLTYVSFHLEKLKQLVRERASTEEMEILAQIGEGTARMKAVISDLLFLTRATEAPQAHVDVRQIISSTLSLVRTGSKATTRIETELPETSALLAHPSRLGQVFLNVILNALEAIAGRADGVVRVNLSETADSLVVEVGDNGAGMSSELQQRVFDPFYTTKPAGTGLGLSISRAIVEAHRGQIAIESQVDVGTTVTVRLPKGVPPASS